MDHKSLELTEAISTDSAVLWLAVHVGDQVHSYLGRTSELKVARRAGITFIPRVIFHFIARCSDLLKFFPQIVQW